MENTVINVNNKRKPRRFVHMANTATATTNQRTLKIHDGSSWTTKTIVANSVGELRVELEIPNDTTININDTLYTDNTATLPANETDEDGNVKPLFVAWHSNNKTGGNK